MALIFPQVCELPTNLQNFTQKELIEVKILQKHFGVATYFETPTTRNHFQVKNNKTNNTNPIT